MSKIASRVLAPRLVGSTHSWSLRAKLPEEMAAKRALNFATSMKIWFWAYCEIATSTGLRRVIVVPSGSCLRVGICPSFNNTSSLSPVPMADWIGLTVCKCKVFQPRSLQRTTRRHRSSTLDCTGRLATSPARGHENPSMLSLPWLCTANGKPLRWHSAMASSTRHDTRGSTNLPTTAPKPQLRCTAVSFKRSLHGQVKECLELLKHQVSG